MHVRLRKHDKLSDKLSYHVLQYSNVICSFGKITILNEYIKLVLN